MRAWERRYGVVEPTRTAGGYRLYDEAAIARLRAMRQLIDGGWSASLAAEAVRKRGPAAAEEVPASAGSVSIARHERDVQADESEALARRFVAAAGELNGSAVDDALDEMFVRGSFEPVMETFVFPALHMLGEAWEQGRVSVAAEHSASHAVVRRVAAAFDAAARNVASVDVIVGLPPGARHEIGALTFATACRRRGLGVTYVGADLPLEDWLIAASGARAAVIGVATRADRRSAASVASALRSAQPELLVFFGGEGSPDRPSVEGVSRLPAHLGEAVNALASAIE